MDVVTATLLILLAGMATVIGGILLLRLHAFLALLLGAMVVGLLTPESTREGFLLEQASVEVVGGQGESLLIATSNGRPQPERDFAARDSGVRIGDPFVLLRHDTQANRYRKVGDLSVVALPPDEGGSRERAELHSVGDGPNLAWQPGDLILSTVAVQAARKAASGTIGSRIASGFGNTCASIGILIAMASIIGKTLLDSGAADRIVRTMLRRCGESRAPVAFMLGGFLLGVPVFFDTVFYLMIPLGKAMRLRTGRNYLLYVLTIVCGGTMAHSLVPPTPGPLFVAEELHVNLGTMILGGISVGLCASTAGYLFAAWLNRRWDLPLRDSEDFSLADVEAALQVDESQLPPFWLAILPVLLPVVLIAGLTTMEELPLWGTLDPTLKRICSTLGEKNMAISLAAAIGLMMVVHQKRESLQALTSSVQKSLASAGGIILITAAGGAFGNLLQQTGIASLIEQLPSSSPAVMCVLAWLITMAIRTAQGSATVAMITAVGVLGGIQMDAHPLYLALAIGTGSKPIGWMNDSGFWVMTRMSGMTEAEGLRSITPLSCVMGVTGLIATLVGVTLWPHL
ncbi:MAG: GntP family permease [Planctomycetaceae bacterium]